MEVVMMVGSGEVVEAAVATPGVDEAEVVATPGVAEEVTMDPEVVVEDTGAGLPWAAGRLFEVC